MLYFTYIPTVCLKKAFCVNTCQILGTFIVSNCSAAASVDKDLALCLSFILYMES